MSKPGTGAEPLGIHLKFAAESYKQPEYLQILPETNNL
jgi:hypothetical protein